MMGALEILQQSARMHDIFKSIAVGDLRPVPLQGTLVSSPPPSDSHKLQEKDWNQRRVSSHPTRAQRDSSGSCSRGLLTGPMGRQTSQKSGCREGGRLSDGGGSGAELMWLSKS